MSKRLLIVSIGFMLLGSTVSCQKQIVTEESVPVGNLESTATIRSSYSCEELIETTYDKMTKTELVCSRSPITLTADGIAGIAVALIKSINEGIIVGFKVVGAHDCIDFGNEAIFLFRDGSILKAKNMAEFNCYNNFAIYLGGQYGNLPLLEALGSKEIESLRVYTTNGNVEQELLPHDSKRIMASVNCIK